MEIINPIGSSWGKNARLAVRSAAIKIFAENKPDRSKSGLWAGPIKLLVM